jgi:hypothetical protein
MACLRCSTAAARSYFGSFRESSGKMPLTNRTANSIKRKFGSPNEMRSAKLFPVNGSILKEYLTSKSHAILRSVNG